MKNNKEDSAGGDHKAVIEKIEAYISAHESDILEDLKKLISFKTVAEEPEEIKKSLEWFLQRAREMGLQTYKTTTDDVGIVEVGEGTETLGILVHLDVVDIGDPDKWRFPPFEGTIAEGCIWGRGTMDDKGAAVICLHGMKALTEFAASFHKKIWLIVGTSEESAWTDMENFKREFPCPDYGFSPDGDFPIYNIENGYADVLLEFDESETIRRFGDFDLDAGKDSNTIPSKAVLTANGRQYVFEGVSAHSSVPEMGVNAIERLCASFGCGRTAAAGNTGAPDAASGPGYNFAGFVNEILTGSYYGGRLNFKKEEYYWEGQYLGRTTVAPTVLKKDGEKVLMTVNIRHNASLDKADIEKAFDEYCEKYHYQHRITSYLDPIKVSRNLMPFAIMAETYEDWGYKNSFVTAGGTSYAKAMKNIVSWGPCFPGELSCAHQENERIGLESLFRAMGIYTDYMYRIVSERRNLLNRFGCL